VVEGSSASADGIRVGDVIRAVDGTVVRAPGDVIAAFRRHASGDAVSLEIIRADQLQQRIVRLRPYPRETMPGAASSTARSHCPIKRA
jgi:S1-C subfamily serine protease